MTFEAFQSYIKENVLKEWREDADIEMAVVRKNNGIELCGLYIRREEEQISPTIYLDEYYSYYLGDSRIYPYEFNALGEFTII